MLTGNRPHWSLDENELLTGIGTRRSGLTAAAASERLEQLGPNNVEASSSSVVWKLASRQFGNPLVLVLLFGATVSLVLREYVDASIILGIVLGSTMLGFSQEYRASAAVAALKRRLALKVETCRGGQWISVAAAAIVPGDIVRLSAGNLVPADSVVLDARDFLVSEASLTGESFPVEKHPGPVAPDAPLSQRLNCIHLGSSVRSGTATAVVVETGRRTELGRIAERLSIAEPETEFERGLRDFGTLLTRVMILVALFVLTMNLVLGRPAVDSMLFAVALAVGLSPELLPAIVSVTLSAGARRLAAEGVIVRRLDAIENLGSIDVLCTDKTGTLTKGDVQLAGSVDVAGIASDEVAQLAFLNASFESGISNPLDDAIVKAGEAAKLDTLKWSKLDEIPYDFIRKRLTIVVGSPEHADALMITKGAVTNVLSCCTQLARDGAVSPLQQSDRQHIDDFCMNEAAQGNRVLALATRSLPRRKSFDRSDEQQMTLIGFLLFSDPLKDGMKETVENLRKLGISIKIISGDSRYAAASIAKAVGLDPGRILPGDQLAQTKDEALWHLAEQTDVFAEVDPHQKERIIRALQKRGHAVGYMGDGINDAPALLAADVGISVDSAVDVARESADVVLLRPDLEVLRSGILDGRRTFANTLKYIKITVSANFGNMISMALAVLWLPFLPLAAKQILLNNFLSDFPSLAISTDEVDPEVLETAQRWSIAEVRTFMIVFGLVSTAFDLVTFFVLQHFFRANEQEFQTTWFVVSVLTELVVVLILRTHLPAWKSRPSRMLVGVTAVVAILALSIPFLDGIAKAFGFIPLPGTLLFSVLAIVAGYAAATEATKLTIARRTMT